MAMQDVGNPIGTVDELLELGMDPNQIPSCAQAVGGRIKGCAHWKKCRFKAVRNGNGGKGAGPENFGFIKILFIDTPGEIGNGMVLPCFTIMEVESQLMNQTHDTGSAYGPFVAPGGTVPRRQTRREHVEIDPTCPDCRSKSGCFKMVKDEIVQLEVKPFPRPKDALNLSVFNQSLRGHVEGRDDLDSRVGGIKNNTPNPRTGLDETLQAGGTGRGMSLQDQVKKAK